MFFAKFAILLASTFTVTYAASFSETLSILHVLLSAGGDSPPHVQTVEELEARSNESAALDFIGLVQQHDGYTAEEHSVTTDDGYILRMHRITSSPTSPKASDKPVILIQHGLVGSSDFFVVLGPRQALPFLLADYGYDVWLGNVRGNTYSRSHTEYTTNSSKFWKFSMDEMAAHDVPSFIDAILKKTGKSNLTYIGYSMGSTLGFMLLSSKPEYNKKVNMLVSLAPVAYFNETPSNVVTGIVSTIVVSKYLIPGYEVLPQSVKVVKYVKESCSPSNPFNVCRLFFSLFTNIKDMNTTAIPEILTYAPAGTSYSTIKHYQQLLQSKGKFETYGDCGYIFCTYKKQEYDTSQITVPNVIFYGDNDIFVPTKDVLYLKDKLKNVVAFEKIEDEDSKPFNHLDFSWSQKAKKLVYERLVKIMASNGL